MAKRYIDTQLYRHSWFRKLTPKMKCVWIYLMTNCDHAGIYDVDVELMSFMIGQKVTEDEIFEHLGDQISILKNGSTKWLLTKFVKFQYGELKDTNNAHRSVIKQLDKYDIDLEASQSLVRGSLAYKDKDKDKDKVKDKREEIKKMAGQCDVIDMNDPYEFFRILEKKKDPTTLGARYVKFCRELSDLNGLHDKDMRVAFKEHWTQLTPNGKKYLFETKPAFSMKARLNTWARNSEKWGDTPKSRKSAKRTGDFKYDTTGKFLMGYCRNEKCSSYNKSDFYDKFNILNEQTRCCGSELFARREEKAVEKA